MNPGTNNSHIKKLIQDAHTMTIATASENNAWAAPVYYVSAKSLFYFFSNPESRHIKETRLSGQAACAIYAQSASWEDLCGIQMTGHITQVKTVTDAAAAIREYIAKFPLIQSFFSNVKNLTLSSFARKFNAKLYCFHPELIYYMDNSIKFGHRKEISKEAIFI
jgi:uncharacterized protein YhbP (UPF0306 family)